MICDHIDITHRLPPLPSGKGMVGPVLRSTRRHPGHCSPSPRQPGTHRCRRVRSAPEWPRKGQPVTTSTQIAYGQRESTEADTEPLLRFRGRRNEGWFLTTLEKDWTASGQSRTKGMKTFAQPMSQLVGTPLLHAASSEPQHCSLISVVRADNPSPEQRSLCSDRTRRL